MKMPELPEPYWEAGTVIGTHFAMNDYFTADQMRAYGEECARLAREEERADTAAWLDDAADEIASWGAYALTCLEQMHDLDETVKRFRDRAAAIRQQG